MMRRRAIPDADRPRGQTPAGMPFALFPKTGTTKTA